MNLGQLKALVAEWVDDPSFGYFSESLVTTFLNNGLFTLHKRLINAGDNWYSKCATVDTVVGQSCYTLPSDFYKLEQPVKFIQGTSPNLTETLITHLTPSQAQFYSPNPNEPQTFYLQKNRLILRPPPNIARTMEISYSYMVSPMVIDADTPDAPTQYHEYIAILGALDCFLKDQRDPGPFIEKRKFYEDLLAKDAEERLEDTPRMVVETQEDMAGWIW